MITYIERNRKTPLHIIHEGAPLVHNAVLVYKNDVLAIVDIVFATKYLKLECTGVDYLINEVSYSNEYGYKHVVNSGAFPTIAMSLSNIVANSVINPVAHDVPTELALLEFRDWTIVMLDVHKYGVQLLLRRNQDV